MDSYNHFSGTHYLKKVTKKNIKACSNKLDKKAELCVVD